VIFLLRWIRLRKRAKKLKQQMYTLWFACKDPRTSWYTKIFAAFIVAYAFSPIDLIPDFIPLIGHLDDLIIVPLGMTLVLKMISPPVIATSKAKAIAQINDPTQKRWYTSTGFMVLWALIAVWIIEIFI
jgi:uncharacterized membrane protein YkvA (DUF1232 family)